LPQSCCCHVPTAGSVRFTLSDEYSPLHPETLESVVVALENPVSCAPFCDGWAGEPVRVVQTSQPPITSVNRSGILAARHQAYHLPGDHPTGAASDVLNAVRSHSNAVSWCLPPGKIRAKRMLRAGLTEPASSPDRSIYLDTVKTRNLSAAALILFRNMRGGGVSTVLASPHPPEPEAWLSRPQSSASNYSMR
jgi:hypothetical protein